MTGAYLLERATANDHDELADVVFDAVRRGTSRYSEAQRARWVPEHRRGAAWRERLDRQVVVVTRCGASVAGFMSLDAGGYIDLAYIRPAHQRTGLFRLLYGAIEAAGLARGDRRMWVHASLMAEPASAALGFRVVERQVVRLGDEHLRAEMEKELPASAPRG